MLASQHRLTATDLNLSHQSASNTRQDTEDLKPYSCSRALRKSLVFLVLMMGCVSLAFAEDYQALLDAYKQKLFAKGLTERGYFRSTGLMQGSVLDSERTVFVTYLGDFDEVHEAKGFESLGPNGYGTCLSYVGDRSNIVVKSKVLVDQKGNGDKAAHNIAYALASVIKSRTEHVGGHEDASDRTQYQYLVSSSEEATSTAKLTYKIEVSESSGIGSKAVKRIEEFLTTGLDRYRGQKYIANVDLVLTQEERVIGERSVSKNFDLLSLIDATDAPSFVRQLFHDLPEQEKSLINGACLSVPSLKATMAFDGLRLPAGKRLGVREGQMFLVSPEADISRGDGLLAAIDMIHLAKAVEVHSNSSRLDIVSEGENLVTGSSYDVSILE